MPKRESKKTYLAAVKVFLQSNKDVNKFNEHRNKSKTNSKT